MKQTGTEQSTERTHERPPIWQRLLLLVCLLLAAGLLTAGDCGKEDAEASKKTKQVQFLPHKKKYRIKAKTLENTHDKVTMKVTVNWTGPPPPPDKMSLTWSPPYWSLGHAWEGEGPSSSGWGDYNFTLHPDPQTGEYSKTFHFNPVSGSDFISTFSADDLNDYWGRGSVTQNLPGPPPHWPPLKSESTSPLVDRTVNPADDYYLWHTTQWFYSPGTTMTSALCQATMDLLQSDNAFFAFRFPVFPATTHEEAYELPVAFDAEVSPTLVLLEYNEGPQPPTTHFTLPLEIRPQTFTFLENKLPSADGEHWMALGVAKEPKVDCSAIPEIADGWEFKVDVHLDFGGDEEAGREHVLPVYYCYEGQDAPFFFPAIGRAMNNEIMSYQGWDTTCIGPDPLRLTKYGAHVPQFVLSQTHRTLVQPQTTVSLVHKVSNSGADAPVTVDLDFSSDLDLPWGIYAGTYESPDIPLIPITEPVTLERSGQDSIRVFWMVADIPEGIQGMETLRITATDVTSPTISTWTSDLLWVGDWSSPDPGPLWRPLYMPLLLR